MSDGRLIASRADFSLLEALAGFYHCRLVPMVEFQPSVGRALGAGRSETLLRELIMATDAEKTNGLNFRLSSARRLDAATVRWLRRLRSALQARGRELWITLDSASDLDLTGAADGILSPAGGHRGMRLYRSRPPGAAARPGRAPKELL
jgi:hypothetical protein